MKKVLSCTAFSLVLLVSPLVVALASVQGDDLTTITLNGQPCGPEGDSKSAAGKAIDSDKNRFRPPTQGDLDPTVSLPAMLAPGNDKNRFDQRKGATVKGFVIDVKVGGKETCNCHATDPAERDTHIELGLAADVPENQLIIVEVTPRMRILMGKKGEDWSTNALRKKIKGQWVEVTGWLLFDTPHIAEAENTNPGNKLNWRASCWEIHPITTIEVLPQAPAEIAGFQPTSFGSLQKLHAATVTSTEKGRAHFSDLHKSSLAVFHDDELAEAREEAKERKKKQ